MKKQNSTPGSITRRQLAGALLTGAAMAQTPPPTPGTPDAELQAAREQNQHTADSLAKVQVPIAVEPAFHFTA
jgi:hypothetical protein